MSIKCQKIKKNVFKLLVLSKKQHQPLNVPFTMKNKKCSKSSHLRSRNKCFYVTNDLNGYLIIDIDCCPNVLSVDQLIKYTVFQD